MFGFNTVVCVWLRRIRVYCMAYTYLVYDEDKELMRKVPRKEEAEALIEIRQGWSYTRALVPEKPKPVYEDAPF
jgi:DNA-directed RNA polymerase subunit F